MTMDLASNVKESKQQLLQVPDELFLRPMDLTLEYRVQNNEFRMWLVDFPTTC